MSRRCFLNSVAIATMAAIGVMSQSGSAAEIRGVVVDAEAGQPVPSRLYVQGADGRFHFAHSADEQGRALRYDVKRSETSVEQHVTLSAHPFVVEVPPGDYVVTAERGKEWRPVRVEVSVQDAAEDVELRLHRWVNLQERGWFSGDTHVHRKLDEMSNLLLAEDLNVALPLTNWVRAAYVAPTEGDLQAPESPGLVTVDPTHVYWTMNTEYELFTVHGRPHTLGAVFVLNHKEPLKLAAPPVAPIAEEARRQGALLDLDKHSWNWSVMAAFAMDVDLFELANNHVWRTGFLFKNWTIEQLPQDWEIETDDEGFTEWGWVDFGFKTYYAFLNCGLPMRPTAGTASGVHPVPVGFGRVYAHVEGPFSFEKWMASLAAGHTFITTGPMLDIRVNHRLPGTRFAFNGPFEINISGVAESLEPLESIEVIMNGEVRETIRPANEPRSDGGYASSIAATIPGDGTSWVCVRCVERLQGGRFRYAHTAPVHFDVPGRPLRPREVELSYFIQRIEDELRRNQGVLNDGDLAEYRRVLERLRGLERFGLPRP